MTIIHVDQSHAGFYLEGLTLDEVKAAVAEEDERMDQVAKEQGWSRTPTPWCHIFEADEVPSVPWAHAQWVLDEQGKARFNGSYWDSSGQGLLEYAVLTGFIALMTIGLLAGGLGVVG